MEKFIPYEKLSKKKRRELDKARRGTWALNPVTRRPENPKAYNRKTARNWKDDSNSVPFCFAPGPASGGGIRSTLAEDLTIRVLLTKICIFIELNINYTNIWLDAV